MYDAYSKIKREDLADIEDNEKSYKYAYITFRHMDAVDLILESYDISWLQREYIKNRGTEE